MSRAVLVLASREDEVASSFATYSTASGVECRVVSEWNQVAASVTMGRDGVSEVCLTVLPERLPVTAVLNRGTAPTLIEAAEPFRSGEILATWWSLLSLFPGQVLNRPSLSGFVPNLEPAALVRAVPGLHLPDVRISSEVESFLDDEVVNVHQLSNGRYLGRLRSLEPLLKPDEMLVYTPFVPETVWRLLVVGKRLFDLSAPGGSVRRGRRCLAQDIVSELNRREATFCMLVLGERRGRAELLHATAFPVRQQYQHLAAAVHDALLDALVA